MPAGTPKRRLSECILDNRLFGGAKSLNPVSALHDQCNAEGFWPEANWRSFAVGRSNQIETALPYQPKQAVLLRILLGHDFFIDKSRLWLAERAK
jgi:hypothetical protein